MTSGLYVFALETAFAQPVIVFDSKESPLAETKTGESEIQVEDETEELKGGN